MSEIVDVLTIRRVANGWVIQPGTGRDEFTHVAMTPDAVSAHAYAWAIGQLPLTVAANGERK